MATFDSKLREVHPKTRAGWRSWLSKNHRKCDGAWLIYHRASTGKRRLSWEDAAREALCFGWIDSKVKPIDPVDALIVPDDLKSALRRSKRAREAFDALSSSAKRLMLYSLYSAKREDTRARRLTKALASLQPPQP